MSLAGGMSHDEFVKAIFLLCKTHDCSITSWYRTKKHNAYVGGFYKSLHLTGFAVDILPDSWPAVTQQILDHFKNSGLRFLIEKTHIHVYVYQSK